MLSSDVVTALKTVTTKVYFLAPPAKVGDIVDGAALTYPYIVYDEASDTGILFADNVERRKSVAWNVTIVNDASNTTIAASVIAAMLTIGYVREMKFDMYRDGEYLKIMRFRGGK